MPSPVLLSFTTMIGRNAASAVFDLRPRHSARRPPSELAPPTSTPNSVRWTATLDDAAQGGSRSASSADAAGATTSGIGDAVTAFAAVSGLISLPAAASGGASIDFEAISGIAVGVAGEFGVPCATEGTAAGPEFRAVAVSTAGFSAGVAGAAAATGDTTGAATGFCGVEDWDEDWGSVDAEAVAGTCGNAAAGLCRATAPVTDSSPCSRTVTREYTWSRCNPIDEWLLITATITAPTDAAAHDPSRHSVRRSKLSSSAKKPVRKPPVFSVSKLPAKWSESFAIGRSRPS